MVGFPILLGVSVVSTKYDKHELFPRSPRKTNYTKISDHDMSLPSRAIMLLFLVLITVQVKSSLGGRKKT